MALHLGAASLSREAASQSSQALHQQLTQLAGACGHSTAEALLAASRIRLLQRCEPCNSTSPARDCLVLAHLLTTQLRDIPQLLQVQVSGFAGPTAEQQAIASVSPDQAPWNEEACSSAVAALQRVLPLASKLPGPSALCLYAYGASIKQMGEEHRRPAWPEQLSDAFVDLIHSVLQAAKTSAPCEAAMYALQQATHCKLIRASSLSKRLGDLITCIISGQASQSMQAAQVARVLIDHVDSCEEGLAVESSMLQALDVFTVGLNKAGDEMGSQVKEVWDGVKPSLLERS